MLETIIFNSLSKYAASLSHANTSNRIYGAYKRSDCSDRRDRFSEI